MTGEDRIANFAVSTPTTSRVKQLFQNFKIRLTAARYNEIFHVLVGIFKQLEVITFQILTHDGTLYPTWARYKGVQITAVNQKAHPNWVAGRGPFNSTPAPAPSDHPEAAS